jgi:hypothetical protein
VSDLAETDDRVITMADLHALVLDVAADVAATRAAAEQAATGTGNISFVLMGIRAELTKALAAVQRITQALDRLRFWRRR